jgi:hypothetical protein
MTLIARIAPSLLAGALLLGCSHSGERSPAQPSSASLATPPAEAATPTARADSDDVPRIDPAAARREVQAGRALLVCAYEDDARYRELKLEGSISFHAFEQKLASLPRTQEIIFYCA